MIKIHKHPEWKLVEKWFRDRVGKLYPASDTLALYTHVEKIVIDVVIDEAVVRAAIELGYAIGRSISSNDND